METCLELDGLQYEMRDSVSLLFTWRVINTNAYIRIRMLVQQDRKTSRHPSFASVTIKGR